METKRETPPGYLKHFLITSANRARDQRSQSEDYFLVDSHTGLLGVFDSVGGRDQGRLVSHLAGKTIAAAWQCLSPAQRQGSPAQLEASLQVLIRQADTAIASLVIPQAQRRPATTSALSVLSWQAQEAYVTIAHIGDSRVYLLREGQSLQCLTQDNGYFPFAVRHGRLTREEALRIEQAENASDLSPEDQAHFARRNKIMCAVGWTDFPHIQMHSLALMPGDCVLLCTDGVHDNLTDQEIEEVLRGSVEASAQRLVSAAYHRSQQTHLRAKPDNISAIIAQH
ncbi:protein-serine/threonine phosphatase [Ktedonobacteria bacterium brp13]|nr:protein-serine/threonine phosphatase [Ktedonobacteria bacterium brp13]